MMMKEIRATLVAYVQPPGVTYVGDVGASDMSRIYTACPDGYRFAVVKRPDGKFEAIDFWEIRMNIKGWLYPAPGQTYDDPDAAIVATALNTDQ